MIDIERLKPEDYPRAAAWLSDPSINRWLAGRWHGKEFSVEHIGVLVASPATRLYLIRDSDEPVGLASLYDIDRAERSASIWYLVDEARRTKGAATIAVRKLVAIAFDEYQMVSLNAWITAGNDSSRRLLERLGFREAGVLRRASLLDGRHVDRIVLDLLPEDFAAASGPPSEEG